MKNVFYLVHNYVLKQLEVFAYMKKQDDVFHFNLLEKKGRVLIVKAMIIFTETDSD